MFNAKEFIETSKEVRKLFYNDGYVCPYQNVETHYFDNYISDNSTNDAVLDKAILSKGIKLLVSQTGSGKTKALTDSAKRVANKDLLIVFALPSRPLTEQLCESYGIEKCVGGDNFDSNKAQIFAVTYEKFFAIKEELEILKLNGKEKKAVLILDECQLFVEHFKFRYNSINQLISSIEDNLFYSVILLTATPAPMCLYRCSKIISFESKNSRPVMGSLKILEVDDIVSYIKNIDYKKEFPFVRLNNTIMIENLVNDLQHLRIAKLTSLDKKSKTYWDIVVNSKIDNTNLDGILTTSLLESGVSICDFPDNIVPIACFQNKYISVDDIEQFFNRTRLGRGRNHSIECAKILLKKPKEKELSAKLVSADGNEIYVFQNMSFHEGNVIIKDTDILNSIADGSYFMKILIDDMAYTKKFTVGSSGITEEYYYSKADKKEISMQIFVFKKFLDILKSNLKKAENFCSILNSYADVLEQAKINRQIAVNDTASLPSFDEDELLVSMILGAISASEFCDCISYDLKENQIKINKRILYMQSYQKYQGQYYYFHEALKEELQNRLNVPVEILTESTAKTKLTAKKKDEKIWDGIEDIRDYINKNAGGILFDAIFNGNYMERYSKKYREELKKIREQDHLLQLMQNTADAGVSGDYILKILVNSQNQKDITKYVKLYHIISMNRFLLSVEGMSLKEVPVSNDEQRLQTAIFYYFNQRKENFFSLKSKDKSKNEELLKEIYDFYKKNYPYAKKYSLLQIRKLVMNMYHVKNLKICKIEKSLKTTIKFQ